MNRLITLVLAILLFSTVNAQQAEICGTMAADEKLSQMDADYDARRQSIEDFTQQFIQTKQQGSNDRSVEPIVTIPVVVHILYGNSTQNLSDAIINSQITVLNNDFRRLNADATSTRPAFTGVASDVLIEFCLANRDPLGNPTTGITRTSTSSAPFDPSFDYMKFNSTGGINAWPANSYLNIWVCQLSGGVIGFAYFPGAPANIDGVVVDYETFGSFGSHLISGYQDGRTTTHEVGHYLNLYHTFQDGCSGLSSCSISGDRVCDTPPQSSALFGCPTNNPNTCSETPNLVDQYENYMDYTFDFCKNMFSAGQGTRMQALFAQFGARSGLVSSLGCAGTIACTSGVALPIAQNFEGAFLPANWTLNNPDASITWEKRNGISGANGGTTAAAWINNFAYNAAGQEDDLATFAIDLTLNASANLTFDVAYARFSSSFSDDLRIDVSLDCGNTYINTVYLKGGSVLATVSDQNSTWTPSSSSQWRNESINLTPYVGNFITVRFTNVCGYGNNLYIDNVNITGSGLPCSAPTNLNITNLTNTSATLNWNAVPAATSYQLRGRALGSTSWINLSTSSTSFSASSIGGNIYEWQVRSVCVGGITLSPYSVLDTFGVGCLYPSSHWTSNVTASTATLNWTPIAGALTYTIRGRVAGTPGWVSLGVLGGATSFSVSGLSSGTTYEWKIKTNCNGGTSAYGFLTSFTTAGAKSSNSSLSGGFESVNNFDLQVYPNPAKDYLNISSNAVDLEKGELHLLNSLGQIIYSEKLTSNQLNSHRVDISNLSSGIYFIKVNTGAQESTVRFLVY